MDSIKEIHVAVFYWADKDTDIVSIMTFPACQDMEEELNGISDQGPEVK